MIRTIYFIILSYFVLGGIGFYFINRKKDQQTARMNRVKFIAYFFIIHALFFSIIINPVIFRYLSYLIAGVGVGEIIYLFRLSGYRNKIFWGISLLLFLLFCLLFLHFSQLNRDLILFTFLVLSIFDAFSQISGQLTGRTKILPAISPGKTLEGFMGGALIAIASSLLLKGLAGGQAVPAMLLATGIVLFAFTGDLAASLFKRKYKVKDFSRLIPGHGGFLDRFDSLIAGGAWIALLEILGTFNYI